MTLLNVTNDHKEYVEAICPNTGRSFMVDKDKWDRVKDHRWRYADGSMWTEINCKLVEISTLLHDATHQPEYRFENGDPLDYRASNWRLRRFSNSPSLITEHGVVSTLHLNGNVDVRIDTKHVVAIDRYSWYACSLIGSNAKFKITVKTNLPTGRQLFLHRLIMGARTGEIVKHVSPDYLDCREQNLWIPNRV